MEKQKILIVDDSEMNREILTDILEDQYDIIEAENGRRAIEILTERREEISLMLLDIMMPEMDGFETLAYINKNQWNESFAVMMISADDSPENIKRAYDLGAFDYISRPFDSAIIQRRILNTMCLYVRQRHLEDMVAEQFLENERNNKLMIAILSHIVEFRNGESGAHVLHVNTLTKLLLKQLVLHTDKYQLSQSDIALISVASSLHDIGKMAISEEILNKPGRLTEEEFETIKTHAAIGGDMILALPESYQSAPIVKMSFEICRWHHERYDGQGYPDGLKGDEIPIAAQGVAIADVYDALTSERCYKKAYSDDQALEMIMNGKCGSFNPLLLQCFMEVADVMRSRREGTSSAEENKNDGRRMEERIDYNMMFSNKKYNFQSQREKTWELLYTDSLTGIYNRRYYDDYIQNAENVQGIAMIDVDNFKSINDNYGHSVGDIVLQKIAKKIVSCVRGTDAVVRYGGDEFAVIFYDMPSSVFERKLEIIRNHVNTLVLEDHPEIQISISVGGAYGRGQVKEIFKIADKMMYQSKSKKNQVTVCFLNENKEEN